MTEIFIDHTKSVIAIQVASQSIHALGFEITVFASDGNTKTEQFTGDTKVNNPFTKTLTINPPESKGAYIRGTFTVMSADGKDDPFRVVLSILENGFPVKPNITLSGNTTKGQATSIATFHIN
ncbi:MAG TPA: hypothetical protein VFC36_04425 [Paludibacter sp.]|nr:hypothetical protein [Paludibacter sp.]